MAPPRPLPNTGYIPDDFDERDKPYYYRGTKKNFGDFQSVDLWKKYQARFEPVYNQWRSSSCVANATSAAVRYLGRKMAEDTHREGSTIDPSRLFIYYNARAVDFMSDHDSARWPAADDVADAGTQIRSAMKGISRFGVAGEKTWPFEVEGKGHVVVGVSDRPSDAAYVEAKATHAVEYFRLDPDDRDEVTHLLSTDEKRAVGRVTLSRLKQCLVEGYPVVFGFAFYWDPHKALPWVSETEDVPLADGDAVYKSLPEIEARHADRRSPFDAGHAVLAVGFQNRDDMKNDGGGRVLCQNSWGAEDGHFWMSYNWVMEYYATSDFWMVRLIDDKQAPSSLMLGPYSDWRLVKDMPDNEQPVAMGRSSTIAMAPFMTPDEAFGMWWVAADGSVQGADYTPPPPGTSGGKKTAAKWSRYQLDGAGRASTTGGIVALPTRVSRQAKHQRVDVFWVRADGSVRGAFAKSGPGDFAAQGDSPVVYDVAGPGSASPSSPLAATGRGQTGVDLVWLREDGSVHASQRVVLPEGEDTGGWIDYVVAERGAAAPGGGLAVASLRTDHLAVFFVGAGADAAVKGRTLQGWTTPAWGDVYNVSIPGAAATRSRVAAVANTVDGAVDVFYTNRYGFLRQNVGPGDRVDAVAKPEPKPVAAALKYEVPQAVSVLVPPTDVVDEAAAEPASEPTAYHGPSAGTTLVPPIDVEEGLAEPASQQQAAHHDPAGGDAVGAPKPKPPAKKRAAAWTERHIDPADLATAAEGHVKARARADTGVAAVWADSDGRVDALWVGPDNALMHATGLGGGDWANDDPDRPVLKTKNLTAPGGVTAQAPLGAVQTGPAKVAVAFRSFDGEIVIATLLQEADKSLEDPDA